MGPPDCLLEYRILLLVLFQTIFDILANVFRSVFELFDAFTKSPCEFGDFFSAKQQEQCKENKDHFLTAQTHKCQNACQKSCFLGFECMQN